MVLNPHLERIGIVAAVVIAVISVDDAAEHPSVVRNIGVGGW
jgi:hypothetical protein